MKTIKAIINFLINFLLFVAPILFIPEEFNFLQISIQIVFNKIILIIVGILISIFSAISALEWNKKVFVLLSRIFIIFYITALLNFGNLSFVIKNIPQINYLEVSIFFKFFVELMIIIIILISLITIL